MSGLGRDPSLDRAPSLDSSRGEWQIEPVAMPLRSGSPWTTALGLSLLGAPLGCTVGGSDPPRPIPEDGGASAQDYPAGPYGINVGSIIENFAFTGYVDPSNAVGPDHRVALSLADFYNPTGEGTHPAGAAFAEGEPLPKALMINVSAVWCGPCQNEAANVLPDEYDRFAPRGAEILLNLADGAEPGVAATFSDLDNWVTTFPVEYPSVVDPTYQMGALFDSSSFPANIIVDTRDMSIVTVIAGVPEQTFWKKLEELL